MSLRNNGLIYLRSNYLLLWCFTAPSDDQVPAAKAPVQRTTKDKTKEAAPKKAPAARKPAASKKKAAGKQPLNNY